MSLFKNVPMGPFDLDQEVKEDKNLWLTVLNEVRENSSSKSYCKTLLVLGDIESGKTSLISKVQGKENSIKGSGIEYHSVNVRDEYNDDHTQLSVWVLDGDSWHKNLLKFALHKENFPQTVVLLTASMAQPWNILSSLEKWVSILEEHIDSLHIPEDVMHQYKRDVLKKFQSYGNFCDSIDSLRQFDSSNEEDSLALDKHTLTSNLGLDIIIVITKTDYMSTLETDFNYMEEHFDFIQQSIRKFCLKYGASLLYTSAKENKNCDLLSKYLVRKVFSYPFINPASFVDKDVISIPSGWDSINKISILYENLRSISPDSIYNEVISDPTTYTPFTREVEIVSEDDQMHLFKMQELLNQKIPNYYGYPPTTTQEAVGRLQAAVWKTSDRRLPSSQPVIQVYPKNMEGKMATVGGENMRESIRESFNNLLNKAKAEKLCKDPINSDSSPQNN